MIIYNVTVRVDADIADEWLQWMQQVHIPDVMATGRFTQYKIMRLLSPAPESNSITYAIQYFCESVENLEAYWAREAPALQAEHREKFQDKALAFRTVLEEL